MKPISLQLYSLREQVKEDFPGTVAKIAAAGYIGIEPAGLPEGFSAEETRKVFDDHGLTVSAYQGGTPVGENTNRLMDEAEALGTTHIVCPYHSADDFKTIEGIEMISSVFVQAIENVKQQGMTFGYHNHEFELALVDGVPALLQLAKLCPDLFFTLDTYWVKVGGQDPVEVVKTLGEKANILHIKDGPLVKTESMTAVGQGKMDFPPIIAVADAAKWLVVEIDRCDGDMVQAVTDSAKYLIDNQLGKGRE